MVKNKTKKIKIVPDTSIIINGILSNNINKKELKNCEIIIPIAVLDELQSQASKHREVGFLGLEELKKLRKLSDQKKIIFKYLGSKPSLEDIKLAKSGRIDGIIRDEAIKNKALLYTGDYVQAIVAEVLGAQVKYIETKINSFKRGIAICEGKGFVQNEIACKAEFNLILPEEIKKYNLKE